MKGPGLRQDRLVIHAAVVLFGLAGLFGKALDMTPGAIVCARALLAAGVLTGAAALAPAPARRCPPRLMIVIGILLADHWVTFFAAIQMSTVAIGVVTFSAFPLFVIAIEAGVRRRGPGPGTVARACVALAGVALVLPSFDLDNALTRGGLIGLLSGLLFGVLTVFNRRFVAELPAIRLALWQNAVAGAVLLPLCYREVAMVRGADLGLVVLLGVVFTGLAHTMFIRGMRTVEATTASLAATLEPVYGVAGAAVLLGEIPDVRTIVGSVIVVGAVVISSFVRPFE